MSLFTRTHTNTGSYHSDVPVTRYRQLEYLRQRAYIHYAMSGILLPAISIAMLTATRGNVMFGTRWNSFCWVDNQCGIDEVTILIEAIRTHSSEVVQAPIDGETIELNVGHAAYSVRLVDTPYQRPEDIMEDSEPPKPKELFEAQLGECTVSRFDFVATGKKVALDGSIVLAPRMDETALKNRPSIYVSNGDVLLTDLRSEIIAQGMKASYSAHVGYSQLVVNGKIVVKKDQETGALDIEGPLCEDFYSVRSIVCGQYVTL